MKQNRIALALLGLLLLALAASPLAAQKNPKDAFDFPKLNPLRTPPVQQMTLKNGIRLFLIEDRRFPTIDLRGMFFASSAFEPAAKAGLASLTGTVLRTGGAGTLSGDEIDRRLETMAADIETGIDSESASVYVSMLKESLDQVLPILADILRRPSFAQDKIDLAKIEARTAISRRNDQVGQIADREFTRLIYGVDSPYARQSEYATLDAIGREDLIAFYRAYFHPDNLWLAVWGDFDSRQMARKLEAVLGDWPASGRALPPLPEVKYEFKSTVNLVEKPDVNQSNILIGHIGGLLSDPDYAALSVMNRILSFDRMFKKVRTDEGLAYSVWGYFGAGYKVPGVVSAGAQTKSGATAKVIGLMLEEMKRMREQEVGDEELQRAKDQFLHSYVFQFDSRAKIIRRLLTNAYYGYPLDFNEQLIRRIEKVSKADVLAAAQRHLRPGQVQILVVGKSADFDQPLSAFGAVNTIDISIPMPAAESAPAASSEALARGKELFAEAIAAMGGAEKIRALRSVRSKGDLTQSTPMGDMTFAAEVLTVYPDKVHLALDTPGGRVQMVVSGDKAVIRMPQGTMPLDATQRKGMLDNIARDLVHVWQNAARYTFQDLGAAPFAGAEARALLISGAGLTFRLFLDPQTRLPRGSSYQTVTQEGPGTVEERLSDYREVGGIRMPFQSEGWAKDKKISSQVVKSIEVNVAMDEGLFKIE